MKLLLLTAVLFSSVVLTVSLLFLRGLRIQTVESNQSPMPLQMNRTFADVTVYVLNTGFVSVKEPHRTLSAHDSLRLPHILLSQRWTEWMPVYVYAVVLPEGVWLVDAGLSEDTLNFEQSGCDPGNRFFYQNMLRFRYDANQRVDRQLERLGVPLASIRGVVFTHRHADHADAFPYLPDSVKSYVGKEDWPSHTGALPCRWHASRTPIQVEFTTQGFGAFEQSFPLSVDRRLRIVPLPGHSPGHLGAMLALDDERFVLFAGDSSFSINQVIDGTIAGISEIPWLARNSLLQTKAQLSSWPTFLLPSHDSESVRRFLDNEVSNPVH